MTAIRVDEDGLCTCCMLPPESCGKAAEVLQRRQAMLERQAALAKPGATLAQYPGTCGDCGEPFDAGTPIQARTRYGRHRDPLSREGNPWRSLLCCGTTS